MESEVNEGKNPVFEMMARRDRERKQFNEKNQRERQSKSEHEGIDYFNSIFDSKVVEIETRLNALQPTMDTLLLQNELTSIAKDLQDLQKYFTSSTIFLHDRKINMCQNIINQLVTKSDDTRLRIMPKKKFGFKTKSAPVVKAVAVDENKIDGASKERKEYLWTDSNKRNQILTFSGDFVNNQDLTFKDMESCVIYLHGFPGSVQMLKMTNCLVLCGAVLRSFFADDCENCTFVLACQQLRLHSSNNIDIYIHVTSRAVIEDCKDINIAPSTYTYENCEEDVKQSGLDANVNNWENVGDFNWLSTDKQSPNWNRIGEDERITDWPQFIDNFINSHNIVSNQ